ncbi:MAG: threonylcarbamoyl-AMP synthase [Spirochaetes bacterium]|nr:threonylcarbamoyl-AMP synthase [Spirochaetota bacterium]
MSLLAPDENNIIKAADLIKSGGLVAFPTETVYGLGANAFDPIAVSKIFETKQRPFFDPLIVHISSFAMLSRVTENFGVLEQKLADAFWPGPLTLILPKKREIPDIVTAGLSTVAVRMPSNEIAIKLISRAETPVAAPSANPFGRISPTKAEHVLKQLGNNIEIILDGGNCERGIESTILKIENGIPYVLRHGAVTAEEIEREAGIKVIKKIEEAASNPETPGQLLSHYSPQTPLVFINDIDLNHIDKKNAGFLAFRKHSVMPEFKKIEILSESGDLHEAAANLFSCLHKLDDEGLDIIYTEKVPEQGLGSAIMDRLKRASKKGK